MTAPTKDKALIRQEFNNPLQIIPGFAQELSRRSAANRNGLLNFTFQ
jgi:hypothetical protein